MPFFIASGGLLVREFVKRIKPVEAHGVALSTRGLHSTTRRPQRKKPKPISNANSDPFSALELRQRMGGFSARRRLSTSSTQRDRELHKDDSGNWAPVYRFTRIGICALVARAKFYQTVASVAFVPYQTYQLTVGGTDLNTYFTCLGFAIIAPIVLIGFAQSFNRLVGVVAFDPETEMVRFGYLSFWGRRKNKLVKLDDVNLLADNFDPEEPKNIIRQDFADGDHLLISTQNAQIVDHELAVEIFGSTKFFERRDDVEGRRESA